MTRLIPALIIGALLLMPLGLLPFRSDQVNTFTRKMEKREPEPFPAFDSFAHLTNQSRYKKLGRFLADRYPIRDVLVPALASFNHGVLKKTHMNGVDWGNSGWAFLHSSLNLRHESPTSAADTMRKLEEAIAAFTARNSPEELGKLLVVVAPDKATIYPEELSDYSLRTYERFLPARQRFQDIITNSKTLQTIDFWEIYRGLKGEWAGPVYLKYDTHHTRRAAGHMIQTILNHLNGEPLWTEPPYSPTGKTREINPDLPLVAGLKDFVEVVPTYSSTPRSPQTYSARQLDGEALDPANLSDWQDTRTEAVRALSEANDGELIEGKTLFVHDSFLAGHRRTLASAFQDVTFRHRNELTACLLQDSLSEYDQVVIEFAERRAIIREGFPLIFGPCNDSKVENLDLGAIKRKPLRGSAASCKPGKNASWKIAGWALAGNPLQKPNEILILDLKKKEIVPAKTIWKERPTVQKINELGPARFEEIGFQTEIRYLPGDFQVLARVDNELYRLKVGKRCRETLARTRPGIDPNNPVAP